jgi:hypothetical protein
MHPNPRLSQWSPEFAAKGKRHRPPPLLEHGRCSQPNPSNPSLARALGKLLRETVRLFQAWTETLPRRNSERDLTGLRPPATARKTGLPRAIYQFLVLTTSLTSCCYEVLQGVQIPNSLDWAIPSWLGRITRRWRAPPPAREDRPTPAISDTDPHTNVTVVTFPTSSPLQRS